MSCLTPAKIQIILVITAALALGAAYIAQYGFGYLPCHLCSYERGIYFAVIGAGLLSLYRIIPGDQKGIFVQLAILSAGIILTFYHVGVEQHWWSGPSSCSGIIGKDTIEDFRTQLMKTPRPHCDQISWSFLKISVTSWSLMLLGALAFITSLGLYTTEAGKEDDI
jgi:disulfide bond formation protein DsbB